MRIAFAIFKFFPHGGVARDLKKIVVECLERGHDVRIYAMTWQGPPLDGASAEVVPTPGLRSHVRQRRFAAEIAARVAARPVDLLVGMNKMPGLDVYYAGDSCFEDKARTQRPWIYRLTQRYRHFAAFEAAVFDPASATRILAISPPQSRIYRDIYGTPAHRFHHLPPGIERDRASANGQRSAPARQALGIDDAQLALLFVGSGFVKKGLDRVLRGVAALPRPLRKRTRLLVVGNDRRSRFERLARRLRIAERVSFLGGRDDVPALLQAADAFVLPASDENTGTVILESMVAGLPVLATANCGYAHYVERADAGIVTPTPFRQERFNVDLERLLTAAERTDWSRNGRSLGETEDVYGMAHRAVETLERIANGDTAPLVAFCADRFSPADSRCRALVPAAEACVQLGLSVRVYALSWRGDVPAGVELVRVPVDAMAEAHRQRRYRTWVAKALRRVPSACVFGFEPIDGIDLFCGRPNDPLTSAELRCLPPGLAAAPPRESKPRRSAADGSSVVFALAGADLVKRGIERLLVGLGRLPNDLRSRVRLLALGDLPESFRPAARVLGLDDQFTVLDEDATVAALLDQSDVFVDLAYAPSSNGWIFDALAAGRAVVTHDWIDEAALVRQADAGVVLSAPFQQHALNRALVDLLASPDQLARWRGHAACFGGDPKHYGQAARIAELIDGVARQREPLSA